MVSLATVLPFAVAVPRLSRIGLLLGRGIGDWAWDIFGGVIYVKLLVDGLGNGLDFCSKLLFDFVQVEAVLPVDQVDGQP